MGHGNKRQDPENREQTGTYGQQQIQLPEGKQHEGCMHPQWRQENGGMPQSAPGMGGKARWGLVDSAGTERQGNPMGHASSNQPDKTRHIARMFEQTIANQQIIVRNQRIAQPKRKISPMKGSASTEEHGDRKEDRERPLAINNALQIQTKPLLISVGNEERGKTALESQNEQEPASSAGMTEEIATPLQKHRMDQIP